MAIPKMETTAGKPTLRRDEPAPEVAALVAAPALSHEQGK
jgi:hypothetical protein